MTVGLTDEIAKHLFDGYTRRWSTTRTLKILDGRPTEPDISALIAAYIDEEWGEVGREKQRYQG